MDGLRALGGAQLTVLCCVALLTIDACVDFLVNMSASADVLAMAKVEVDLSTIPEGKNVRYTIYSIGYTREGEETGAD